jgi:hypothetical protein
MLSSHAELSSLAAGWQVAVVGSQQAIGAYGPGFASVEKLM